MNLSSISSGNGLSPDRRQAITWTNADLLSIGPLGTNFNENGIKIWSFSFMKIHLKMLSDKMWPFCLGGDELKMLSANQQPFCSGLIMLLNFSESCKIMAFAKQPVGFITKLVAAHHYRGRAQGLYFLQATPEVQNRYCQLSHSSWSGWFETWVGFYLVATVTDSPCVMWCNKPIRDIQLRLWQKQNIYKCDVINHVYILMAHLIYSTLFFRITLPKNHQISNVP